MGSWKGKLVFQQYGLHALDGADCDRRGRDFPPSTLALAGASHIATSLKKNVSFPPPLPRKHTGHAPHTHTPTAARACLSDVLPSRIHHRPRLPA
jgi:hypothetical protein